MRFFTFIFAFLFCLQPLAIMAELYQWTDENGVTHFSNTQPDPGADVRTMKEQKAVDDSRLQERRDKYQRSIDRQRYENETRRAMEERQKESDQRSLSIYERQRDYHQQQARQYEALLKNEKLDLRRAKERYSEIKREPYSNTKRRRRRLDLYKNRVENSETSIEMYRNKIEHHEGQAREYQRKIDRI